MKEYNKGRSARPANSERKSAFVTHAAVPKRQKMVWSEKKRGPRKVTVSHVEPQEVVAPVQYSEAIGNLGTAYTGNPKKFVR